MSRAKAKLALLRDLQCKQPDYILTKRDCELIRTALVGHISIYNSLGTTERSNTTNKKIEEMTRLYLHFLKLING